MKRASAVEQDPGPSINASNCKDAKVYKPENILLAAQKISRQLETSAMSRTKTKLMELIRWKLLDVRFLANNQSPITIFWFIPVTYNTTTYNLQPTTYNNSLKY